MSTPVAAARRRLSGVLAVFAAVAVAVVLTFCWQQPASATPSNTPTGGAYPPSTSCTLSVADNNVTITPGSNIHLLGSGFGSHQQVDLTIHSADIHLATITANADGSFATTVTIPGGLATNTSHVLTASSPSATCSFDPVVTSSHGIAGVSAEKPPTSSSGLASTGFQTAAAIAAGLAILGAGALLLVLGRRRRA